VSPRVAVALACLAAAGLAAGCGSVARNASNQGNASVGKQLFVNNCGTCHTLADAGTSGTLGPNLDDAFRAMRTPRSQGGQGFEDVQSTITDLVRGQIAYPTSNPPSGEQGMPANLVKGEQADDVAAYVASVAGTAPATAAAAPPKSTNGKALFKTECGGCHTLAAAGTHGTIGPNLDQLKPSMDRVVKQDTNGGPGMPAFKGKLTEAQIKAVAKFVSSSAGK
jgi:mono/diheme cytochrome c family protein